MASQGPPAAPSAIEVLETLQRAKKNFHDRMCEHALGKGADSVAELREDNVFMLVEYLFMFDSFGLGRSGDMLESYIAEHNRHIAMLLATPEERRRLGLSPQRIERGQFTPEHIEKARANLLLNPPGLDQADLQRLTVLLFSPETTRRTIEVLEETGFIERVLTPFRSKIVHSFGIAETLFATYLEEIGGSLNYRT